MEKERENLETLRHSASHLLAHAVLSLYPGTKIGIGPAIDDGFYYDFEREEPFTPEDLEKIESKMRELSEQNFKIERFFLPKNEAIEFFKSKNQDLKVELIEEKGDENVSLYRQDDFVDFCLGPHMSSTGEVKFFKLLSVAGAYWKGDEKGRKLQRIYGTAFFSKEELDEYLKSLEEAKKRDHRKLGPELDLFSIQDSIGAGLILWHPKGAMIRKIIEDYWKDEHLKNGYELLYTPHIARIELWKTSGHLDFYRENMYPFMEMENQTFQLKPMNCPFHIQVYKTRLRSYRELPIRWAELGTVYRFERSGVLHGLLRVRGFTQDDAHLFVAPSQLEEELERLVKFNLNILKTFGFEEYDIYLSTRPEKFVGEIEDWDSATYALENALKKTNLPYKIDPGMGAFYGPKIDINIKDSLGRLWQCSTIQVDFNLPKRFDIEFIGEDGKPRKVIMIHRAIFGSLERFFGILIEHYEGNFPLWLSPVQVAVIPVSEKFLYYSSEISDELKKEGIRVEIIDTAEKIGYRIRKAEMVKIPLMLIVGEREEKQRKVSLRIHKKGELGSFELFTVIEKLKENIKNRNREILF
ncbi:MAG: threonine--tRNA ligase [Candidatus Aminicenantia bacterium]